MPLKIRTRTLVKDEDINIITTRFWNINHKINCVKIFQVIIERKSISNNFVKIFFFFHILEESVIIMCPDNHSNCTKLFWVSIHFAMNQICLETKSKRKKNQTVSTLDNYFIKINTPQICNRLVEFLVSMKLWGYFLYLILKVSLSFDPYEILQTIISHNICVQLIKFFKSLYTHIHRVQQKQCPFLFIKFY